MEDEQYRVINAENGTQRIITEDRYQYESDREAEQHDVGFLFWACLILSITLFWDWDTYWVWKTAFVVTCTVGYFYIGALLGSKGRGFVIAYYSIIYVYLFLLLLGKMLGE